MTLLAWDDAMSVGVAEIDAQHQGLFDLANELHDAIELKKDHQMIDEVLTRLVEYTVTHFATEERYMAQFQYTDLAKHAQEHQNFVGKVAEFRAAMNRDNPISQEVMDFLAQWLVNHIIQSDRAYMDCFKDNGLR